ncbi:MAG: flavin reductase [Chloroflexi bacterium]|nr:flavin reductase [Chloroflexota bacterium]
MDFKTRQKILRQFTYGMYAVSAQHNGASNAFLANWLAQCSFDPPMVMISVERDARTLALMRGGGYFVVHVLATGQREFAGMLGRSSRTVPDKLKNVRRHPSALTGCPILEETLGYVECRIVGELPAGDSVIVTGQVLDAVVLHEGDLPPLTMQETGFKHAG